MTFFTFYFAMNFIERHNLNKNPYKISNPINYEFSNGVSYSIGFFPYVSKIIFSFQNIFLNKINHGIKVNSKRKRLNYINYTLKV